MKLASCIYQENTYVAIVEAEQAFLPALNAKFDGPLWRDMLTLIASGEDLHQVREQCSDKESVSLEDLMLLAPIPKPSKNVMCLGLNYMDHAEETAANAGRNAKKPEYPIVFTKSPSSVIGQDASFPFDEDTCQQLDWEVELGVVIGKPGKKIEESEALNHVFGYTVINDLSARDIQREHKQWFLGKSLDGGCPMGPWIVTADELVDPQSLDIACRVNGVTKQTSNTQYMMYSVAQIIACLSRGMTLEPGDVIATGTPSGVGFVREPQEFLLPGDTVECEVGGIGVLRTKIGLV